jgi:hypothetical protein
MGIPIHIPQDNNNHIFDLTPPGTDNWTFTPPYLYFFWIMNQAAPAAYIQTIKFPELEAVSIFELFTDWQFEVAPDYSSVVPFCNIVTGGTGLGPVASGFHTKSLTIGFQNLNLLSAGQYFCYVQCMVSAVNPDTGLREVVSEQQLTIELQAQPTWLVNPFEIWYQGREFIFTGMMGWEWRPMIFTHHLGDAPPALQDLFFYSRGCTFAPTTVASDLVISAGFVPINMYFSKFLVGFNAGINSLAPGEYTYTFEMSYFSVLGYVGATATIKLLVQPAGSGSLSLNPTEINLAAIVGGPAPDQQILSVSCVGAWNVVGLIPDWLQLSDYDGFNNSTIVATPINYNGLPTGTYTSTITIESGADTLIVNVTLEVTAFLINPFIPGKLYFTKDLDYLKFASITPGTYIAFVFEITVYKINSDEPVVYIREFKLPLFKGTGEFHVGTIVHTLFEEILKLGDYVPDTMSNFYKTQYRPAEVKISFEEMFFEEPFINLWILVANELPVFKMIQGHKPFMTQSQMCLLTVAQQDLVRVSRNSILGISFTHLGSPRILVKKNGTAIDDFIIVPFGASSPKIIFSYFRFINDTKPGDNMEIIVFNGNETRAQRFLVMSDGVESTFFFFRNDFGVLEPFEFTGRRRINSKYSHTTTAKFKNLNAFSQKAFSRNLQTLQINSGQLLKAEHKIVDSMLHSEKIWCSLTGPSGPYILVDAVTTKLQPYDTFNSDENFDVEFNILEDTDANVFPF